MLIRKGLLLYRLLAYALLSHDGFVNGDALQGHASEWELVAFRVDSNQFVRLSGLDLFVWLRLFTIHFGVDISRFVVFVAILAVAALYVFNFRVIKVRGKSMFTMF